MILTYVKVHAMIEKVFRGLPLGLLGIDVVLDRFPENGNSQRFTFLWSPKGGDAFQGIV